ncbi:MAG: hypothetical protein ACTHU0_00980 [Kofleriaceae bacterium]
MRLYPVATTSVAADVTTASTQFTSTLVVDETWLFVSSTDSWIAQGANPTATAGAGSMFVPARVGVLVEGLNGAKLAVIRDSADGKASLTRCQVV